MDYKTTLADAQELIDGLLQKKGVDVKREVKATAVSSDVRAAAFMRYRVSQEVRSIKWKTVSPAQSGDVKSPPDVDLSKDKKVRVALTCDEEEYWGGKYSFGESEEKTYFIPTLTYVGACPTCAGSGKQKCNSCGGDGKSISAGGSCPKCSGTGKVSCCDCGGSGAYTYAAEVSRKFVWKDILMNPMSFTVPPFTGEYTALSSAPAQSKRFETLSAVPDDVKAQFRDGARTLTQYISDAGYDVDDPLQHFRGCVVLTTMWLIEYTVGSKSFFLGVDLASGELHYQYHPATAVGMSYKGTDCEVLLKENRYSDFHKAVRRSRKFVKKSGQTDLQANLDKEVAKLSKRFKWIVRVSAVVFTVIIALILRMNTGFLLLFTLLSAVAAFFAAVPLKGMWHVIPCNARWSYYLCALLTGLVLSALLLLLELLLSNLTGIYPSVFPE